MKPMTRRERLTALFEGKPVDRPALKLWGLPLDGSFIHPAYEPVCKKALECTDLFAYASSPFDVVCGQNSGELITSEQRATDSPLWIDDVATIHTPLGDLTSITRLSTVGEPGYIMEHPVKEPKDFEKILSIPYTPYPFDPQGYQNADQMVGDRGIPLFDLDHSIYAVQRLCGSENLAFFSVEERDMLHTVLQTFSNRLLEQAKKAIDAGIRGVFSWVGPEVCIPPLMSPKDFEDFVYRYDKPICDAIHEAGGHVWVHCHGKVNQFVERFADMGVDILNPLEPPKNGDVDMKELATRIKGLIGLEGNIEIQEILQAPPERLKQLIADCVAAGKECGRFILCPSAGFMEYPTPTPAFIENLMLYLEEGYRQVEACR